MSRECTAFELAAMYHFHDRYAAQGVSAIAFYKTLSKVEQAFIVEMVNQIVQTYQRLIPKASKRP